MALVPIGIRAQQQSEQNMSSEQPNRAAEIIMESAQKFNAYEKLNAFVRINFERRQRLEKSADDKSKSAALGIDLATDDGKLITRMCASLVAYFDGYWAGTEWRRSVLRIPMPIQFYSFFSLAGVKALDEARFAQLIRKFKGKADLNQNWLIEALEDADADYALYMDDESFDQQSAQEVAYGDLDALTDQMNLIRNVSGENADDFIALARKLELIVPHVFKHSGKKLTGARSRWIWNEALIRRMAPKIDAPTHGAETIHAYYEIHKRASLLAKVDGKLQRRLLTVNEQIQLFETVPALTSAAELLPALDVPAEIIDFVQTASAAAAVANIEQKQDTEAPVEEVATEIVDESSVPALTKAQKRAAAKAAKDNK